MAEPKPGTIGIISGEIARFSDFNACLLHLERPPGSRISWARSSCIASNLNAVTRDLMASGGEWLWVLGDDHMFHREILMRLLDHDVDIVAPLVTQKVPPFSAVVFERAADDPRQYYLRTLTGGRQGLVKVDACGNAGMLIRRHVFEVMSPPWWEIGQVASDKLGEDLWFCRKARDLDFDVFVDTECAIGHMGVATYWPKWREDGTLGARLSAAGQYTIELPAGSAAR